MAPTALELQVMNHLTFLPSPPRACHKLLSGIFLGGESVCGGVRAQPWPWLWNFAEPLFPSSWGFSIWGLGFPELMGSG